jgi:predicted ester cyclase
MNDPKWVMNRFIEELWNGRRLDVADSIFSPHCVTHQLRSGLPMDAVSRSSQDIKVDITQWITSFPDLWFRVEQMLCEGDRVVMRLLAEGTHEGEWMGIPATSRKIQIRMFTVHRVIEGRIAEDWFQVEWLGVFQQLGVVPSTPDLVSARCH